MLAVLAVLVVAAVGLIALVGSTDPAPASGPRQTVASGDAVSIAPRTTTPSPTPSGTSTSAPIRVVVSKLGIDAPVLPTHFTNDEINPPTVDDVYWIEDYGWPGVGSDNTVYLLGHSWDNGDAVFNALFDRASQTSRVETGDEVDVITATGTVRYVVDRTARYPRATLKDTGEVWEKTPGRLILITYFQRNDGLDATDNFVVYAHVVG